jgi:hypothetical protein
MESRGAMIYMVEPVFEDFHDNSYIGLTHIVEIGVYIDICVGGNDKNFI